MIKRLFIFMMLTLMALIFFNLASNYTENTSLSKLGHYYTEKGPQELGAANLVTAVVVTYRGLDTLGEVTVLFISAAGVGLLLRRTRRNQDDDKGLANEDLERGDRAEETANINVHKPASEIVETATELLLPMVILFGVYVFMNGHLSPGGGFQGGAIIASGTMFLLLALPTSHISRLDDRHHRVTVRFQLCRHRCAWRNAGRRLSRQPYHAAGYLWRPVQRRCDTADLHVCRSQSWF